MDREQDADDVTREVLIAVRRTFITPFDRGDIKDLITSMDNSIDQMQKTAKTIMLFDVSEFTPQMKEMADAIVKCARTGAGRRCRCCARSDARRRTFSAITEQISQLEGRADELHDIGLQDALSRQAASRNAMAFFVGNEIYDHLEKVVDRFDDVANEMHGIVIEHV